ncbi:hypothetical protein [Mesorhizobium sp. B2-4-17]|uniref:hypothetical protein n=1 Tax=Mesorhizobium sp. B2-4-17 TaxID=2589932 RepID=UPI0011281FA0|nr:hypothetical protein [Mesorhizobium sp. B2-4-17]TPK85320.1 hypothetical protein FJ548_17415 [Mesorhizobium sp. B2-4-17]
MNVLFPDQQKDLGALMNLDVFEAERIWRQDAHAMAKTYFAGMDCSPQTPQEIAEIGPVLIALCAEMASPPVALQRVLRLQLASRAAFYERLRVLVAESTAGAA